MPLGKVPPMMMKDPSSTVHFQDSTTVIHSYDPKRASTAPSLYSELVNLQKSFASKHENDERTSNTNGNIVNEDISTTDQDLLLDSLSRTHSVLSEQSSVFSCMNRELMDEAYIKYESFTPFKTPLQSKHLMASRVTTTQESRRSTNAHNHQQPQHLQQVASMQTLDAAASCFLPVTTAEGNVQRNSSFIGRSISPSRSMMFRKQQLTTSSDSNNNINPSEMRISKVQLLPAREKSPFVIMKIKNNDHQYSQQLQSPTPTGRSVHQNHQKVVNKHLQLCQSNEACVPPPSPVLSKASNSSLVQPLSNVSSNLSANDSVDSFLLRSVGDQQVGGTVIVADIASHLDVTCYNDQIIDDENQSISNSGNCNDDALLVKLGVSQDGGVIDQNQQGSGDVPCVISEGTGDLGHQGVDNGVNSSIQESCLDVNKKQDLTLHHQEEEELLVDSQKEVGDKDKELSGKQEEDEIPSSESLNGPVVSIIIDPPLLEKKESELVEQTPRTNGITGNITTSDETQPPGDGRTKKDSTPNDTKGNQIQGNLSKDATTKDPSKLDENPSSESLPVSSPIIFEDLTDGLALDLELDSEIMKAFDNIDDFVLSDDDDDDDDDDDELDFGLDENDDENDQL